MRKLSAIVGLICSAWTVISCRGKEGPQGPPGPPGPPFSLPKDGYIRGLAIIRDNSGRRYEKEFSYEYGYPGSIFQLSPNEVSIDFSRYGSGTDFTSSEISIRFSWDRTRGNTVPQAEVRGMIILSGTLEGSDTLKYFTFYDNNNVSASVSNLFLEPNNRLKGAFLAVKEAISGNTYADTIRGTFDVQLKPVQEVQRIGTIREEIDHGQSHRTERE